MLDLPPLPSTFAGETFAPGDAGYDEARDLFNHLTSRRPALIARCADADDAAHVLRHASANDLPVAVRSGGHGAEGLAMPDDALVVDLSRLRGIEIDPVARVARVEAGVLLGELDHAAQAHGMAVPAGTVTTTGIAGLTLGGGVGLLMRRHGVTVDSLLGCEVVTVEGERLRADRDEHPELFWGLRGGGGNFAVVTRFDFRLHRVGPEVVRGQVVFPVARTREVLGMLDGFMAGAPRDLTVIAGLMLAPPAPGIPDAAVGTPILMLLLAWTGDPAAAERVLAPLTGLPGAALSVLEHTTWPVLNSTLDAGAPWGGRTSTRGGYLPALTPEVVDLVLGRVDAMPPPPSPARIASVGFWSMGGAIDDVDEHEMAFSREGARWFWDTVATWYAPDDDEAHLAWVDGTRDALRPHSLANAYVNLTSERGRDFVRRAYGEAKYERLSALKAQWDPANLLRHNKNIEPRAAGVA